jgi:alginate O-acetyltransferase complex protein AlgI
MIFPTPEFAAFFAVVLPLSWLLMPFRRTWKAFMIGASYSFYGANKIDWHFIFLLAFCTLWNQLFAKLLGVPRLSHLRNWLVAVAVAGDLSILGWFKYYGFFVANVVSFTHTLGLPMPLPLVGVIIPIAVSFFTFQAISYVIDVKRDQTAAVSTLDFALYLCFFPHLIAGPIVRVFELVPQFAGARDPRKIEFSRAMGLICGGLIKKVIIADTLKAQLVDPVFSSPALHSRLDVMAAIYGYAVQIFCDFSGYTDIAIGLALLLGFQFPQNFNKPYAALSITDFWHRWHMTLSRWLRDYLYIPLGGNRKGPAKTYRNLMLTMLLGGLWHGANWTFVLWGGMHGAGLAVEKWWSSGQRRLNIVVPVFVRWLMTFNFVCLAWVFFRAGAGGGSMGAAGSVLGQFFSGSGQTTVTGGVLLAILAGMAVNFIPAEPRLALRRTFGQLGPVGQGLAFACVVLICGAFITGSGVADFIYFQF